MYYDSRKKDGTYLRQGAAKLCTSSTADSAQRTARADGGRRSWRISESELGSTVPARGDAVVMAKEGNEGRVTRPRFLRE